MVETFILLKERAGDLDSVMGDNGFIDKFVDAFGAGLDYLAFMDDNIVFRNGYAFRCRAGIRLNELYRLLEAQFDRMDAWALFDTEGNFLESAQLGPIHEFMWIVNGQFTQIYLMANDGDLAATSHAEALRVALNKSATYKIFEFEDGCVLFGRLTEPLPISVHRCDRALSRFAHWAFVGPDGEERASSSDVWRPAIQWEED